MSNTLPIKNHQPGYYAKYNWEVEFKAGESKFFYPLKNKTRPEVDAFIQANEGFYTAVRVRRVAYDLFGAADKPASQ